MPQLVIELLGPLVVSKDGQPLTFSYEKVRALLAYLAVESGPAAPGRGGISRARLAGLLWPDQPNAAAQDSLRQALSRLRSLLEDREALPPFLLVERDTIQLNRASSLQIDLDIFMDDLARSASHHHRSRPACPTCAALLERGGRLVRGDFLEDVALPDSDLFETWATTWRERLKIQALNLFSGLAQFYERRGEIERGLECAARQIEIDPYHEPAHRQMMLGLVSSGQRSQAVLHFNNLKKMLDAELGIEPAAETLVLFESIRQGAPLADPNGAQAHNLPLPMVRLVGRVVELSELLVWLADPDRRLISLVGPGGVGKTRLALEAARQAAGMFEGGVIYVPLVLAAEAGPPAALTAGQTAGAMPAEPPPLVGALAAALGLGGAAGWAQVLAALRNQEVLLALDGIEHVFGERERVEELLESNARLVVLTTSRQRLALPGEWVFGLGGLETSPASMDSQLEAYSAGALFCQCAQQANRGFVLNDANRASIGEICRLVGGLPLAIRLAASWASSLSCAEIAAEIRRSLDILSHQPNTEADEAQSGVRAIFEQSWTRLFPSDQGVFARLSVFRGGLDRAGAEQVAGATMETLARLVDQSLLRMSREGRYDLHDLLSQFGAEKLKQSGAEADARQLHFEWFYSQAEQNERMLASRGTLEAFTWLIREAANLREALAWGQINAPEKAGQLARWIHADFHHGGVHRLGLSQPWQT